MIIYRVSLSIFQKSERSMPLKTLQESISSI